MVSIRLVDCIDCTTIPSLLADIDCKLTDLANIQYNNIVFMLNQNVPTSVMGDLLNYKRILTFKKCNPDYASEYTIQMIADRIKLLIHK
jgi:hypothetical protein